jgi:hypothetical protein
MLRLLPRTRRGRPSARRRHCPLSQTPATEESAPASSPPQPHRDPGSAEEASPSTIAEPASDPPDSTAPEVAAAPATPSDEGGPVAAGREQVLAAFNRARVPPADIQQDAVERALAAAGIRTPMPDERYCNFSPDYLAAKPCNGQTATSGLCSLPLDQYLPSPRPSGGSLVIIGLGIGLPGPIAFLGAEGRLRPPKRQQKPRERRSCELISKKANAEITGLRSKLAPSTGRTGATPSCNLVLSS